MEPATQGTALQAPISDAQRVSERWADLLATESASFSPQRFWLGIPEVHRRYQAKLVRGRRYRIWWEYCLREFLKDRLPAPRMLSIGCGAGDMELALAEHGAFQACDACDISVGAIATAQRTAQARGITSITFSVCDANTGGFPEQTYDAVWFNHSLHHIAALEHVCEAVARALKPDGYLFLNEYVGPNRFDFPPTQRNAANRAFTLLAPRYRHSFGEHDPGTIRERIVFPDPATVAAADPSESVRSADILAVVPRFFEIVTRNDGGGTLLHPLLSDIAGNFLTGDPAASAVLRMLFAIEDAVLADGELHSDFALVVARPIRARHSVPVAGSTDLRDAAPAPADAAPADALPVDPSDAQRIPADRAASAVRARNDPFSPQQFWLAVPEVNRRYHAKAARGLPYPFWWEYCLGEFLKGRLPAARMLSIGGGMGKVERALAALGAFQICDAWDQSPSVIADAERATREAGISSITFAVRDANTGDFPVAAYDAVWFNHSLHRITALEHVCEAVARALKPDGYLFLNGYVGPNRFDFPPAQQEAADHAFALIPPRYRHSFQPSDPGAIRQRIVFPDPAVVAAADPTEAVRSADILDVVSRSFEIVTCNDAGGTLLHPLLQGIAGNFRTEDPESIAVLNMLFAIEDTLLESGELSSDFALVVARPKATAQVGSGLAMGAPRAADTSPEGIAGAK